MALVMHYGYVTFCKKNNLIPYYTTVTENEVIEIKSADGSPRIANSLVIEAVDTTLYIAIDDSDFCLVIEAGTSVEYALESVSKFQVVGSAGQKIKWYAQTYR